MFIDPIGDSFDVDGRDIRVRIQELFVKPMGQGAFQQIAVADTNERPRSDLGRVIQHPLIGAIDIGIEACVGFGLSLWQFDILRQLPPAGLPRQQPDLKRRLRDTQPHRTFAISDRFNSKAFRKARDLFPEWVMTFNVVV
mgnify:CR=1 FL=1